MISIILYFDTAFASERLRVLLASNRKRIDIQLIRAKIFEIKDLRSGCPNIVSDDTDEISTIIDNIVGIDPKPEMTIIYNIESQKVMTITLDRGIKMSGIPATYNSILIKGESGALQLDGGFIRGDLEVRVVAGTLSIINIIDLEEYLRYTISREMSSSWHVEALKAQAVLARTYALRKKYKSINCLYDIGATTMDQVYGTFKEDSIEVVSAVSSTRGEVLKYKGELIEPLYHSCCGGQTSDAREIFNIEIPYLKGTGCQCNGECPYGQGWTYKAKIQEIADRLGLKDVRDVVLKDNKVEVVSNKKNLTFSKNSFRAKMGFSLLRSSNYTLKRSGNYIIFEGKGFGHNVGLCQYGARRMAEEGRDYREILLHYFKGVSIEKFY